jgi:dihydroflavonol-4-reductase
VSETKQKALVTGGAGFIGSHVVRTLVADGHPVRVLHLPGDDLRNLRGLDVELVPGDVTDRDDLRDAMRGCDWVFHLAAIYALWLRDPSRMRHVNVEGTRRVFEIAREVGVARVVYTSSIARFGGQGHGRRADENSPFALGPTGDAYARSKAEAHEVAVDAARDLDVTIVAPTGPLGPGDVGPTPTGRLLLAVLSMPLVVVTRTETNFADVRDIARGHVLAAKRGRRGESYLLGHRDLAIDDLARLALDVAGLVRPVVVAPTMVARMAAHAALAFTERVSRRAPLITPAAVAIAGLGLTADCSKAVRELGMPQTPLEIAVRDALCWFAREGYVKDRAMRRRMLDLSAPAAP